MIKKREKFIKDFIYLQKKRGVKVKESIQFLSVVLFVSEGTVRGDYYK